MVGAFPVPSDSDEEHSSQSPPHGVVGCIIDLTRGEHAPVKEDHCPLMMSEEELEGMEEDLEESIALLQSEEEEVHR
jgi:hypothetical protein